MRISRNLGMLIFGLVLGFTNNMHAQKPSDLTDLRQYFKTIAGGPYTYLQGANTDMAVGTLVAEVDGTQFFVRKPESCFTAAFLTSISDKNGKVEPIDVNRTANLDLAIGLNAAQAGPLVSDVKAEFNRKAVRTVTIKYGTLTRTAVEIDALKQQIIKEMDPGCKRSFTSEKGHRYIIAETLSATDFSISFKNSAGNDVGISAKIYSILFPSFKSSTNAEITGAQTIQRSEPLIVAIKAIKPKTLHDKFAGGESQLDIVDPDSFYKVFDTGTASKER
jgi:hypothetical protein